MAMPGEKDEQFMIPRIIAITFGRRENEAGYSFAFAMGVILIFLLIGGALLTLVVNESNMVVRHYDYRRAYYLAEAGINRALFELNQSPAGDGVTSGTLTVGGQTGSYSTTYGQSVLTATGTFPSSGGVTKTIVARTNAVTTSSSWANMAALAAREITDNIPSEMTIWNGPGDTDPNRVALYSRQGLNINGYVLNYNQLFGGTDYLGWAYNQSGSVGPGSNVGTHFREASSASTVFPTVDSTTYDNMIENAGSSGTELSSTISGTQTYGPGIYYRTGNLTISNATIQTNSSVTRDNPVYIVVKGKITITNSTIGVTSPTNLADPSQSPSASNPYGNWIRILVGDEDSIIQGTISDRTYINKEVRIYINNENTLVRDYVTMDQAGLYMTDRRDNIRASNGTTWLAQASGTSNRLYAVDFSDSSNGIAVGAGGTVKYTANGGSTWNTTTTSISGALRGVSFPSTGNAWVVGDSSSIWYSSNGGSTWAQQTTGGSQLNGVSFADSNYGVAVGAGKTIKYTTNGGSTWQNATSTPSTSPNLNGVKMRKSGSNYIGWAVGTAEGSPAQGTIWYTGDGGQTWTAQTTSSNSDLYGVSMIDASNGWISGASGTVLRTTDGGTAWAAQSASNYTGTARSISAYDTYQSLMVGSYADSAIALHTTNGGYTWDSMSMPTTTNLYGVSFVDKLNGWAVGDSGTVLKYTGPSIYLRGTVLASDETVLSAGSGGGEICIEGALAVMSGDGGIEFGTINHLVDIMFDPDAMPESTDDVIGGSATSATSVTLDYSSWREK